MRAAKRAQKRYRRKKRSLRAKADKLWHKACLKQWGNKCFFADYPNLRSEDCKGITETCHHFKRKGRFSWLRYSIDVGVPICWNCHYKLEKVEPSMIAEIVLVRGRKWYNRIERLIQEGREKASFKTLEWYKEQISRLNKFLED